MKEQARGKKVRGSQAVIYALSALLVFSFILFEVLDIDGSNISTGHQGPIGWAEPSEGGNDIRQSLSDGTSPLQFYIPPPATTSYDESGRPRLRLPSTSHFFGVPHKHTFLHVLPRATLSDPSDNA